MLDKINSLKKKDDVLAQLIEVIELETLRWHDNVFEDLVSCLLDSQIRYRGKAEKYRLFKAAIGCSKIIDPNAILNIPLTNLNEYNLNSRELFTLANLAMHWKQEKFNEVNWHSLGDGEVRKLLLGISSISEWTVDMILLYSLQRPDIFPISDSEIRNSMRRLYSLKVDRNINESLLEISSLWSPYRSTAVIYLLEDEKKHSVKNSR